MSVPSARKSPGLAVLLSLVPGLGHVYVGQLAKGIALFVAASAGWVLLVVAPAVAGPLSLLNGGADWFALGGVVVTAPLYLFVIGPALVIYSMADSYRLARNRNATLDAGAASAQPGAAAEAQAGSGRRNAVAPAHPANSAMDPRDVLVWGSVLAGLGALLILGAAAPAAARLVARLWPLLLIGFGLLVIFGHVGNNGRGRG